MIYKRCHVVVIFIIASFLPRAAAATAASQPLPSAEDIRILFEAQRYREAMQACQRIIALKDDATAGYNRHAIRMLCVECQLHQKMAALALDTLESTVVAEKKAGNEDDLVQSKALAFLIRSSPHLTYIPISGEDRTPLDILDSAKRKAAYSKLLDDRVAYCETQERTSKQIESLVPLLDLARTFNEMRAVERMNTQGTRQCDRLGGELAVWSGKMIHTALNSFNRQVTQISRDTNIGANGKDHRRGRETPLSADEINVLKNISATCQKVPGAIDELTEAFAVPLEETSADNRTHAQNIFDRISAIMSENDRANEQPLGHRHR